MSKILVYILDRIVWMLVILVITTQALQMAGIVESPKSLGEISYSDNNNYNYQLAVGNTDLRGKRQTEERSKFIDSLFNLPIQTLNALNTLVQNSRPAFQKFRDYMQSKSGKSTTTTKAPEIRVESNVNTLRKRSPVYIRPVGEEREAVQS
ncbi:uncharacterized protein LOC109608927 [Aethina tumida]|uniref:uncharacterized protein LOC109608927 n=1 Tax=Aethina tumida TaxID=116153 RepID=UPI00096B4207|nr:uncharacterized protein LOC109608927 [Aethina tumida]